MKLNNLIIVPIVGHGATDFIILPKQTLIYNFLASYLVLNINYCIRKNLLIIFSIIHISNDIVYFNKNNRNLNVIKRCKNYLLSLTIHKVWLKYPIIAKLHLLLVHTPLHYFKIIKSKKYKKNIKIQQLSIGFLISFLSYFYFEYNKHNFYNKKYGELYFLGPIISHILLTAKINII